MKKMTLGLLALTLSLCTMPSAHAVRLVSLINVGSGHMVDRIVSLTPVVSNNEGYREQFNECRSEVGRLQDELVRGSEIFQEAEHREYDLRREEMECRHRLDRLQIDFEECLASRETSTSSEDAFSIEDEISALVESGDTDSDEWSENWSHLMDYLFNGTCEEPRHDQMRERCLDECYVELRIHREGLENMRALIRDVRGFLEENIESCRQQIDMVEVSLEVTACSNGDPEDDSDEMSHDAPDWAVIVDPPSLTCGLVHCP